MSFVRPPLVVNPGRTFAPGIQYRHLKGMCFEDVVKAFESRIRIWYLEQALRGKVGHEGFLLSVMSCIVLDLLSQYRYDLQRSEGGGFRRFVREYIPEFDAPITPPLQSSTFSGSAWRQELITSLDHALWHGFRCGIMHNGMILEYGRISGPEIAPNLVQTRLREDGLGQEVAINPRLLIERVSVVFGDYIQSLLDPTNSELRNSFASKFERDFGLKLNL